jgi:small subunit ribosomal protein S20
MEGFFLANTKSAIKRIRSSEKRRVLNRQFRTQARTCVKKAKTLIEAGEIEEAKKSVVAAIRALDKAAEKGIIHRNNAARRKSRLVLQLNRAIQGVAA